MKLIRSLTVPLLLILNIKELLSELVPAKIYDTAKPYLAETDSNNHPPPYVPLPVDYNNGPIPTYGYKLMHYNANKPPTLVKGDAGGVHNYDGIRLNSMPTPTPIPDPNDNQSKSMIGEAFSTQLNEHEIIEKVLNQKLSKTEDEQKHKLQIQNDKPTKTLPSNNNDNSIKAQSDTTHDGTKNPTDIKSVPNLNTNIRPNKTKGTKLSYDPYKVKYEVGKSPKFT